MKLLRRFISYYRPFAWLFWLDMSAATLSSLLSIVFPYLTRYLIYGPLKEGDFPAMGIIFLVMLVIYLLEALFTYIRIRWGHILGVWMEHNMRQELFDHLETLSFRYYDLNKTGGVISRITNDLFNIAECAHHCPEDFLISMVTIVGAYILMSIISIKLAIISVIPLVIMLIYGIVFGGRLKARNREIRKSIASLNVSAENSIQGIREVKSFSNEQRQSDKFRNENNKLQQYRERMYAQMATFQTGMTFIRQLYYLVTVAGGAVLLAMGDIQFADLFAFILYVSVVTPPLDRLINFTEQFQGGVASFERFTEVMDIKPEIEDKEGCTELKITNGDIQFNKVSFTYEDGDGDKVVASLDLDIKGGQRVALVGESGAGKTTIVNLLSRFYESQSGDILIDGQSIKDVSQSSLHRAIGFVQQSVFLFDTTIKENLLYGKVDATDEELWEALRVANLYDFVASLPKGLDTEVGERGTRLSGGQKQRISIARVFLKNPPILVFDEATSSLDTESEAMIQEAFNRISKGRTSIVIAHRLSTIIDSDCIYVIEKGKVVESGTHSELLKADGTYARLYNIKRDEL